MPSSGSIITRLMSSPSTPPTPTRRRSIPRDHAPKMVDRLCGVETLQPMSENQLVAEARRFFKRSDRMRPQI
jgi:hypothetical protein